MLSYTKKSLNVTDYVVTVSKYSADRVREVFGITNLQVIYNGIDTEIFKSLKSTDEAYPDKIKLLFVGNLTRRKGVDLLPKIMSKLDSRFILFYTTGLRTYKKAFSDSRMFPLSKVPFSDIPKIYNSYCDILVAPSRLEGFGYSVAEAMACGKPVVTTNCSSLPELVDNEKSGFLCEMDNVSDFVAKIKVLAGDRALRETMGKYGREKVVREFNLLKMGTAYAELYNRLIHK
jgi:glycosyltransferase involved in cell wall biosynthesis